MISQVADELAEELTQAYAVSYARGEHELDEVKLCAVFTGANAAEAAEAYRVKHQAEADEKGKLWLDWSETYQEARNRIMREEGVEKVEWGAPECDDMWQRIREREIAWEKANLEPPTQDYDGRTYFVTIVPWIMT